MPIYTFKKQDGTIYEAIMPISHLSEYKKTTDDVLVITAPKICDPNIVNNNPNGFREVLKNIHNRTAGSILNKTTEI